MHQSNILKWFLLAICLIATLAGVFQISKLIGLAIYSDNFNANSVQIWQVGLISSGVWGAFEFVRTMKKLKASPEYN